MFCNDFRFESMAEMAEAQSSGICVPYFEYFD